MLAAAFSHLRHFSSIQDPNDALFHAHHGAFLMIVWVMLLSHQPQLHYPSKPVGPAHHTHCRLIRITAFMASVPVRIFLVWHSNPSVAEPARQPEWQRCQFSTLYCAILSINCQLQVLLKKRYMWFIVATTQYFLVQLLSDVKNHHLQHLIQCHQTAAWFNWLYIIPLGSFLVISTWNSVFIVK